MRLWVGTSERSNEREAVAFAARQALANCAAPCLALVFSTFEYAPSEVAAALGRELGEIPFAGLVTPAILAGGRVMAKGVAVGILDGDGVRIGLGRANARENGAREAGSQAMLAALAGMSLPPEDRSRAVILLTDIGAGDAGEVVSGALRVAGAGVAWCGGGAGAHKQGPPNALYAQGQAHEHQVVAVALDLGARVGVGIHHGWSPTGAPATVTRAAGAVVQRLEHRPAFEIYRAAAAARGQQVEPEAFAAFALTHPLGIPQAAGEYLIRDPVSVDAEGAIHFTASVPDGALLRMMDGSAEMLIEAARLAAAGARNDAAVALGGALVFDCISRQMVLGERLEEELSACQSALGGDVPLLGCLSFGEVGAFSGRLPQFHNKTIVVLAIPT